MAVHDMLMAAGGVSAGGGSDSNFKNVTLLLNGDGTNGSQNNTFVDSSSNNFTITRNGNTTQGSFSPYGDNWSNFFSSSRLNIAYTSDFNFGMGNFTIEAWVYFPTTPTSEQIIAAHWYTTGAQRSWAFTYDPTLGLRLYAQGASTEYYDLGGTIPTGKWTHIVLQRYNKYSLWTFIDGVKTFSDDAWFGVIQTPTSTATYGVGGHANIGNFSGYISNFRMCNAPCYLANFTPSTIPLSATYVAPSGTDYWAETPSNPRVIVLTCASNMFLDKSPNTKTITTTGSPSVQRFSPFNPTASYDTATIGGSGYFDGSGDYLNVATSGRILSNYSFCIEAWVYPTVADGGDYETIIGQWASSGYSFICQFKNSKLRLYGADEGGLFQIFDADATIKVGTWSHLAFMRSGNTWYGYVNGIQIVTANISKTLNDVSTQVNIGRNGDNNEYMKGILSNVRIVVGNTVYDTSGNFTPPTAPLTAISGTRVLTNFTNAGISDSAMMNDLETVGNAQVSTSVKKFGTGSIAFDGSGDILQFPASQYWNFSSGDWTIEGWLYPNTVSGGQILLENTTNGTGGLSIQMNGSAFLVYINSTAINAGTFTASTWQHFALVRSGSTMTAYINGSSVGTSSTTPGSGATGLWIGSRSGGSISLNGYIDDLRITKGYARYTSNFTPPTAALPVK